MKFKRIWIVTLLIWLGMFNPAMSQFFYGGGNQIDLNIDSLKMCIKFDEEVGQESQEDVVSSIERIVSILEDEHVIDGFQVCSLSTGSGYDDFLDSVQSIEGIYMVEPYYLSVEDSVFLVGEQFCVGFYSTVSQAEIDSINDYFNVVVVWEIEGMSNVLRYETRIHQDIGCLI